MSTDISIYIGEYLLCQKKLFQTRAFCSFEPLHAVPQNAKYCPECGRKADLRDYDTKKFYSQFDLNKIENVELQKYADGLRLQSIENTNTRVSTMDTAIIYPGRHRNDLSSTVEIFEIPNYFIFSEDLIAEIQRQVDYEKIIKKFGVITEIS